MAKDIQKLDKLATSVFLKAGGLKVLLQENTCRWGEQGKCSQMKGFVWFLLRDNH